MYQMTNRLEVPITTLADGTCCVVIQPYSAFLAGWVANSNYLPLVQVSSVSSTTPYSAISSYNVNGPFQQQAANTITYAPDFIYVDYINT